MTLPVARTGRPGRCATAFLGLGLASLILVSGCGGEGPPPAAGSEKYEAERQAYREARGREYGRKSIEPGDNKTKRGAATQKGRSR